LFNKLRGGGRVKSSEAQLNSSFISLMMGIPPN